MPETLQTPWSCSARTPATAIFAQIWRAWNLVTSSGIVLIFNENSRLTSRVFSDKSGSGRFRSLAVLVWYFKRTRNKWSRFIAWRPYNHEEPPVLCLNASFLPTLLPVLGFEKKPVWYSHPCILQANAISKSARLTCFQMFINVIHDHTPIITRGQS